MIDEKIARVKKLIEQREKIDAELTALFGGTETPRRGRPRKEPAGDADSETSSPTLGQADLLAAPDSKASTRLDGL